MNISPLAIELLVGGESVAFVVMAIALVFAVSKFREVFGLPQAYEVLKGRFSELKGSDRFLLFRELLNSLVVEDEEASKDLVVASAEFMRNMGVAERLGLAEGGSELTGESGSDG